VGGHFGFLAQERKLLTQGAAPDGDQEDLWQRLRDDRFALERRMMLEARIDGSEVVHTALNDFYFRPGLEDEAPTCVLELEIDGEVVDQYRGDGLIMATATGSTGYSMAAGGPILHPGVEAIVVNPICAMSLSSRPLVVPPRAQLAVWPLGESNRRVRLWKDGAHATVLEPGDRCLVGRSPHPAVMVLLDQSPSYYRSLSRKLHWAGSLTAAEPSPN
jgi:NAD+ kinase